MIEYLLARGPYLLFVLISMVGVYLLMAQRNGLKAVVGLYLFQTAAILLFIILSFRSDGSVPIIREGEVLHNALPHAMMLTAIVVGVATLGVAIAILRRLQAEQGTIEERSRPGVAPARTGAAAAGGSDVRRAGERGERAP